MLVGLTWANSTKYAPYLTRRYVEKSSCPVLMKIYTMRLMLQNMNDPQDFISDVAVLVVEILIKAKTANFNMHTDRSKMDIFCREYP